MRTSLHSAVVRALGATLLALGACGPPDVIGLGGDCELDGSGRRCDDGLVCTPTQSGATCQPTGTIIVDARVDAPVDAMLVVPDTMLDQRPAARTRDLMATFTFT